MANRIKHTRFLYAAILLTVFTVNFIPKFYFHDLLASNCDNSPVEHRDGLRFTNFHYHCGFVNDMMVTPFVESEAPTVQAGIVYVNHHFSTTVNPNTKEGFFCYQHRGPPALSSNKFSA